MIKLIYGKKGSGKSKRLLDLANAEVDNAPGNIVYIDDNNRCMYDLKHEVRFINSHEYGIDNADKLYGFVCGILSEDFDISSIYIDGLKKMMKSKDVSFESLLQKFENVFADINAHMVISGEEIPEYMKKYVAQ